jgi:hypothetical protein
VLIVDDAQWLDRDSAEVPAFVACRLYADPVACLLAVREPAARPLLDGRTSLCLHGLPEPDRGNCSSVSLAGRWMSVSLPGPPPRRAATRWRWREGRASWPPANWQASHCRPGRCPVYRRLEERFGRQVRNLTVAGRC